MLFINDSSSLPTVLVKSSVFFSTFNCDFSQHCQRNGCLCSGYSVIPVVSSDSGFSIILEKKPSCFAMSQAVGACCSACCGGGREAAVVDWYSRRSRQCGGVEGIVFACPSWGFQVGKQWANSLIKLYFSQKIPSSGSRFHSSSSLHINRA